MNNIIVVDTCIFSYRFKNHSLAYVYEKHLKGKICLLSFQTLGEVFYWALKNNWGNERKKLCMQIINKQYKIVHSNNTMAGWFAFVMTARKKQPISIQDAWIAATALDIGCPLLTHNA
jgi:predicted nucleic acid-binding protein